MIVYFTDAGLDPSLRHLLTITDRFGVREFNEKVKAGVQFKVIVGHHGMVHLSEYFGSPLDLFSHPTSQLLNQGPLPHSRVRYLLTFVARL